jgi:hypothetical protein
VASFIAQGRISYHRGTGHIENQDSSEIVPRDSPGKNAAGSLERSVRCPRKREQRPLRPSAKTNATPEGAP